MQLSVFLQKSQEKNKRCKMLFLKIGSTKDSKLKFIKKLLKKAAQGLTSCPMCSMMMV